MAILIIGAAGFVGTSLLKEYLQSNQEVYAVVSNNIPVSIDHKHIIKGGLEGLSNNNYNFDIELVYDFAWSGTSGPLRADANLQLRNVRDRMKVIDFCSKYGCRYVGAGSVMEKESLVSTFNDSVYPNTSTIYTHAKYMAHAVSKAYASELGVDYVWGRITNAYGPNESTPRLISSTIKKIIDGVTPEFSSGNQWYDFIHINDLARAFIAIAEKGKTNTDYLLGSGDPRRLHDYLDVINKLIAPNMKFKYGNDPDASKMLDYSEYSTVKLQTDTGFKPKISFEKGILDTFKSYGACYK